MPYDSTRHTGGLRRLPAEYYQGLASVHWCMTLRQRAVGWLNPLHHAAVRELLCHALSQTGVICPAYCLMPDHGHFIWIGTSPRSNQREAMKHFRTAWNRALRANDFKLQKHGFEHVLTTDERQRDAFRAIVDYVFANPVRAGLAENWCEYPYSGCVVPGYPELNPREPDYWERFWRVFALMAAETSAS